MANKLSMALVIALVATAAMLHGSSAQTTHVVGDTTGWTIPTNGGASTYSTWASRNTFKVGDILVFRFTTGTHDVTEVSRAGFDGCNATNPISQNTNGPAANITLRTAGQHYYICSFPGHCGIGQKLAINVSAAASTAPAPQPSAASPPRATPASTPAATPAPVPSRAPASTPAATLAPSPSGVAAQTYTVGDSSGWTFPAAGSNSYQTWVRNKNFNVGDTLVFNFPTGAHNVAEVSKSSFDSCSGSSPIKTENTGPARITLATPGEHYYICTFGGHCSAGMKLAVNVTGTASSPSSGPAPTTPPSSTATPPSSTANPPSVPSADSPPPPSTAAPSIAVAALPVTILSVALAFLY